MLIIDGHLDLSWNALQGGRDLTTSAHTIRAREHGVQGKGRGSGTVAYPEMRQGRVALCFATLFARSTGHPVPHADYATPMQAYGTAHGQLAYYRALEQAGHVRIIQDRASLDAHIASWEAWDSGTHADPTPPLGFVISMEGADPIITPDQLEHWHQHGLRLLGLTHYGVGRYAGGTATEVGLTSLTPALLGEMERLGIVLDLTHCSDAAFWQALDRFRGPVIASHQNCRALVPHQRQFSDDQLRALIERDGVIGAAFDAWMLHPAWRSSERFDPINPTVTLSHVVDQIEHVCQIAGNARHAAIGSDLDGGFGREDSPRDMDTIADLQKLDGLLAARGYSASDIAQILHGNWLRLLRGVWKV